MSDLSHLNAKGEAHMVDVSGKDVTTRVAIAGAEVLMAEDTFHALTTGTAPKGDVLATARIAGIMAAKKTSDLIPLCHPLALSKVEVDLTPMPDWPGVAITATVKTSGKTGVEMEALTAASTAALTLYDMLKAVEKGMTLQNIRLLEKTGGKSGDWHAGV